MSAQTFLGAGGVHQPPLATVVAGAGTSAPTVVSGLSAGTGACTIGTPARLPVKIRPTNIHPTIKTIMDPHITLCKGVALGAILDQLAITVDDLPKLPGEGALCYNYVLGRCVHPSCQNKDGHINVADLPEDFITALLDKIQPAIIHFKTNGPPVARYTNRRRHRE